MTKAYLMLVLLLLIVTGALAEDGPFRLRERDTHEFLAALPEILREDNRLVKQFVSDELAALGDLSAAPFELLYAAHRAVQPANWLFEPSFGTWNAWVVMAWLRDEQIMLDGNTQLAFEDYLIDVTAVDFYGDGQDEWLLEVLSENYHGVWLLEQAPSGQPGYRRGGSALIEFGDSCYYSSACEGAGTLLGIQDVNADQRPDLLLSKGFCGSGRCTVLLEAWSWSDDLTASVLVSARWDAESGGGPGPNRPPRGSSWRFENLDDDAALELRTSATVAGSMDCTYRLSRTYDWNPDEQRYIEEPEVLALTRSSGCDRRLGHLALRDGDYPAAAEAYRRALSTLPGDTLPELRQYVQLRLALAYALSGQTAEASDLLTDLTQQEPTTPIIQSLIDGAQAAWSENPSGLALCAALFQGISKIGYYFDGTMLLNFSQINDYGVPMTYVDGGDFGPANSGCNLPLLFEQHVQALAAGADPVAALGEQGWAITGAFSADLNGDQRDDWLIWSDPLVQFEQAQILLSGDAGYQVRSLYFPPPADMAELDVLRLPGSPRDFVRVFEPSPEYNECPNPADGYLMRIYALEAADVFSLAQHNYMLCDRESLEAARSDATTFASWEVIYSRNCLQGVRVPVATTWDESAQAYVQALDVTCSEAVLAESASDASLLYTCGNHGEAFCGFYSSGQEALDLIDAAFAQLPDPLDEDFVLALRSYRARALALVGQPDDALAEYVTIYESAPDSAWGVLASLHLAPLE